MRLYANRHARVALVPLFGALSMALIAGVFSPAAFADPISPSDSAQLADPPEVVTSTGDVVTVTLNANGGPSDPEPLSLTEGNPVVGLPAGVDWQFHYFLGWFTDQAAGSQVKNGDVFVPWAGCAPDACILFAHWLPARHYVFNANGGTVSPAYREMKLNTKLGALPTPTRSYYKFLGWYTKKSGGTKVTSTSMAPKTTGTTTLYAHWQAMRKYTFYGNWGKVSFSTKTVKAGSKIGTLPKASRGGYSFMGWYTAKAHGGSKVTSSTSASKTAGATTLYARWAPYPLYQFDKKWRDKPYSGRNMRNFGCGPTSAAMVVRALKGDASVTPWTAAKWATDHHYNWNKEGRTKPAFFTKYPLALDNIIVTEIPGGGNATAGAKALAAVKSGDWVIGFMGKGNWAVQGHYILWYDVAGSRALVRDPVSISTTRTQGSVKMLLAQARTFYIVSVASDPAHANKMLWK